MGLWSDFTSLGSKAIGNVGSFGQKAWKGANDLGQKVSSVAHDVLDNEIVEAIGLAAAPELYQGAKEGLAFGDNVLKDSKTAFGSVFGTVGTVPLQTTDKLPGERSGVDVDRMRPAKSIQKAPAKRSAPVVAGRGKARGGRRRRVASFA